MKKTAILIDGGFFIKRFFFIKKKEEEEITPEGTAKYLFDMCLNHLKLNQKKEEGVVYDLYRIFYYDCLPYDKKQHNPIDNSAVDYSKTKQYNFKISFLKQLKKKRKIAIRLGTLEEHGGWVIKPKKTKLLLKNKLKITDLTKDDVEFDLIQKGVDMKIGLDIASMAFKKQVDQIILISGDSDFVSAAKLARREGIDFVLDPMWNSIKSNLFEHIDGIQSQIEKPNQ